MARILIVDDAAFMRMMLKDILTKGGFEIAGEAADGNEAVAKYNELKPDLVTLDITMPNKDGIQALKEIKAADPNATCVMCSAMGQQSMVIDAIQSGAKDFIVKPFPYVSRSRVVCGHCSFSVSGKAVQQIFQIPAAEAYIHLWLKQLILRKIFFAQLFRYPKAGIRHYLHQPLCPCPGHYRMPVGAFTVYYRRHEIWIYVEFSGIPFYLRAVLELSLIHISEPTRRS